MDHSIPHSESGRAASEGLSGDALYGILSDRRRRDVLYHLNESEERVELADLAQAVAVRETGSEEGAVSATDLRRVHVSLYHAHVPKLAAANAVAFDRSERTVALTETGREVVDEFEGLADQVE
ncbi:DUF7344 domain-containing protein [Halalkalicoccus ordinarius]|uniref:DUF7344 domain-containing protein n=1 Tax=Halalkalicoccus ordinarius TaxID=3116651 RepID=UPI00300F597C